MLVEFFFLVKAFIVYLFILTGPGLSCGTWGLLPWPGMEPGPPALGAQSLIHWTSREAPWLSFRICLPLASCRKHEVLDQRRDQWSADIVSLTANSQQAAHRGQMGPGGAGDPGLPELWMPMAHPSLLPTLDTEGETFALWPKAFHSGERRGCSLGFYNHLECKQMALGLSPLENEEKMNLRRRAPFLPS